jgi:hypothetical protein
VKLINSETTGTYFANRRTFSILYLKGIMIFDTRTGHFVSNREFIAVETPPLGGAARFDDYIARYIGFGNWPWCKGKWGLQPFAFLTRSIYRTFSANRTSKISPHYPAEKLWFMPSDELIHSRPDSDADMGELEPAVRVQKWLFGNMSPQTYLTLLVRCTLRDSEVSAPPNEEVAHGSVSSLFGRDEPVRLDQWPTLNLDG